MRPIVNMPGGPSHVHRQHAQKFDEDRACGSADILPERQTDIHSKTYLSQYLATAPAGEVITVEYNERTSRNVALLSSQWKGVR